MAKSAEPSPPDPADLTRRKAPLARVAGEMMGLSPWRKKLLALFLLMAAVGLGLWVHGRLNAETVLIEPADSPPVQLSTDGSPPPGARGFVGNAPTRTQAETSELDPDPVPAPAEREIRLPWTGQLGGWLARFGLSFAVGLVIGVFFRTFLKTMAMITAVAIAAVVGLSYFQILPIDFEIMRSNYDTAAGWVGGQAGKMKDFAIAFLPSATAGGFGFFVGFLRR